jgi:hypothetical protein
LAFKGPALAAQTTGDSGARGFGDIDLLVDPHDLHRSIFILEQAGWTVDGAFPRQANSWIFRQMLVLAFEVQLNGFGQRIDLHWRMDSLPDSSYLFDDVWRRHSIVHVAGRPVATLGLRDALAQSCSHAAKDEWAWLRSLADIHRLARLLDENHPDWTISLRPVDRDSLTVVDAYIGLPSIPVSLKRGNAQIEILLARASVSQNEGVETHVSDPWHFLAAMRRRTRYAHSPLQVASAMVRSLLVSNGMSDIRDSHAITAVPKAILFRLRQLGAWWKSRRH